MIGGRPNFISFLIFCIPFKDRYQRSLSAHHWTNSSVVRPRNLHFFQKLVLKFFSQLCLNDFGTAMRKVTNMLKHEPHHPDFCFWLSTSPWKKQLIEYLECQLWSKWTWVGGDWRKKCTKWTSYGQLQLFILSHPLSHILRYAHP